ncbi:MAG: accessory factor UbiK family protein [Pseudomonadota bacterium]
MQTRNPIFDDMARLMTGAVGAAQAAGDEAKGLMRAQMDRAIADMDLAGRDEVEALKLLARSALEKIEALEARVAELEAAAAAKSPDSDA